MSELAIKVTNLSKRYRIGMKVKSYDTFIEKIASYIKSPIDNFKQLQKLSKFKNKQEEEDVIWALDDINFELKHGEVLGVIGANGAGKSTLLKVLAQITEPTTGRVTINGRVASLLEVGTGFHPDLTGRENVYLNGTILGMTKREIDIKFDEIVEFSGVEKFIDTPIKRYSSGMKVRLAFAVAAFLEPEILLIDEVLAVGDANFQSKCLNKMDSIAETGRTVLFVSHNMLAVKNLCKKGLLVKNGKLEYFGDVDTAVREYHEDVDTFVTTEVNVKNVKRHSDKYNAKRLRIDRIKIFNTNKTEMIYAEEAMRISLEFSCFTDLIEVSMGCSFYNMQNIRIFDLATVESIGPFDVGEGAYNVIGKIDGNILKPGLYKLDTWARCSDRPLDHVRDVMIIRVSQKNPTESWLNVSDGLIKVRNEWTLPTTLV